MNLRLREQMKSRPNQITAIRLGLLPILWVCALLQLSVWVGIGLIFSALSDIIDGIVARRSGQITAFGSRFDSIADALTSASAVVWIAMLRPDILRDSPRLLPLTALIALSSLVVGLIRFRRVIAPHLHSARIATVVAYPVVIHALIVGDRFLGELFYLAIALAWVASIEALLLVLRSEAIDGPVGSLVLARRTLATPGAQSTGALDGVSSTEQAIGGVRQGLVDVTKNVNEAGD